MGNLCKRRATGEAGKGTVDVLAPGTRRARVRAKLRALCDRGNEKACSLWNKLAVEAKHRKAERREAERRKSGAGGSGSGGSGSGGSGTGNDGSGTDL